MSMDIINSPPLIIYMVRLHVIIGQHMIDGIMILTHITIVMSVQVIRIVRAIVYVYMCLKPISMEANL